MKPANGLSALLYKFGACRLIKLAGIRSPYTLHQMSRVHGFHGSFGSSDGSNNLCKHSTTTKHLAWPPTIEAPVDGTEDAPGGRFTRWRWRRRSWRRRRLWRRWRG